MKKTVLALSLFFIIPSSLMSKELWWDWNSIDTSNMKFPQGFQWGVASSEFQNSGAKNCPKCDWALHEDYFKSGDACDSFNRVSEDIAIAKSLGVNTYRLSIEWSLIEPEEGQFDESILNHYKDFCDHLIAAGIKPHITLHHFTNPQWFAAQGQFEREENIPYFERYCVKVVEALKDKVSMWSTINEPGVYAFSGYVMGTWPPFNHVNFAMAGKVQAVMMRAHEVAYDAIKKVDPNAQVGIVHDIVQFEPYFLDSVIKVSPVRYMNHIFHGAITNYLLTGNFKFQTPTVTIEYQGKKALDFIGLNYYSHVTMIGLAPKYRAEEIPTDMPYGIYAEGLYRAIKTLAPIGVPIYITENGISDAKDDRRELWLKRYLYAVSKAIEEGYDVRGYYHWSLLDNFEWNLGYNQHFGLCAVDPVTKERTLRKSANYYIDVVKKHSAPAA